VNCWLYLSVLLGLRGLNEQTQWLQRADRNVLEHKVAVGRQRQSLDDRLGFFNRCGVHKEDHAAGLILAEPELVNFAVEIEPQSVGTSLGKIRFLCSSVSGLANKPKAKTFMIVLLVQNSQGFDLSVY